MKKKLLSIILVIILLLSYSNCALAALNFTRTEGELLTNKAVLISDDLYIDNKFNAESVYINGSTNVSIYDFETTNPKTLANADGTPIFFEGNENKYYYKLDSDNSAQNDYIYYAIKVANGDQTYNNIATFVYKDAITYNEESYDVKLNIKRINKTGAGEPVVTIRLGKREHSDTENAYDLSTYTLGINPYIHIREMDNDTKMEVETEVCIIDKNGNPKDVSGILAIDDVDLNQGTYLKNFIVNNDGSNIFVNKLASDEANIQNPIKYKTINSEGTYFYATNEINTINNNAYALLEDKSNVEMTLTWDGHAAGSGINFVKGTIKTYHKITTKVTGGTITPTIQNIKDGEEKTITYSPNANKYLKSITVDGRSIDVANELYMNNYTFSNITSNHKIAVVYEDKLTVTHDAKGGEPTPQIQYVTPNDKAAEPADPTKTGYDFVRWQKTGTNTEYDYDNTPVTENITIEAVWTPINYKITYITNGGENNPDNPDKYTIEDTIDFKNPTREGYDFLGWYEDEELTKPKDGISHEVGDKTVYAKWQAKKNTIYKVEHYKEKDNGEYELIVTDELTAETDSTVTATPKEYTGFKENTTYKDRRATGTVAPDGSLVLKLYYDKIEYEVTFDTKGGSKNPDNQIVKYNETATKPTDPTKTGYDFVRWQKIGTNTEYDYDNTPVTENITIEAVWTPINYKITYITNGGENNPDNPDKYTIEDTIDFKNPTREGYDFLGWNEDEELTKPKDGISHEVGDKTVYAKWQAKKDTVYKVEHYKEKDNGEYELVVTDELTAETDSTVTAIPKEYIGFKENTTYKDRIATGTVAPDGSLILKLYYDKIEYKVTFDTKGGSKNPDNQIVKYNGKATKPTDPTKTGHTFQYWYYIDDEGKEVQYNFDDLVTKNVDLYAKWNEIKTVTPSVLPKTGATIKNVTPVIGIISIIALAGIAFKRKYNDLKDI